MTKEIAIYSFDKDFSAGFSMISESNVDGVYYYIEPNKIKDKLVIVFSQSASNEDLKNFIVEIKSSKKNYNKVFEMLGVKMKSKINIEIQLHEDHKEKLYNAFPEFLI